ncbi:MAG: hypothetical protein PHC88_05345 [Terrimicrobiaceae bacterium]|nr:hypothetical protein [Terrimicrobiaceae bacterium]
MKKKKPSRFKRQRNAAGQFEPTKPKSATVKSQAAPAGAQKAKPPISQNSYIEPPVERNDKLDRQKLFLEIYAQVGNVSKAAEHAELNRCTHYEWMDLDPTYPERFHDAESRFLDRVRDFVRRRAIDGVPEPLIWQGEFMKDQATGEILTVLKRSDRILELLAQARCPEFKQKRELTGPDGGALKIEVITGVPQAE